MDRRWPWKKKSSGKAVDKPLESGDASDQANQDRKEVNYVQISVESYSHLTGLEDQVKTYEGKVRTLENEIKEMNEKLSAANSDINTKETIVKQHAKVAEEAVLGWEKAEAEALALKNHLESVTLSKLTAEDRASHLDGALKECMRQIRNLKEEHEQKIQEVALAKTKQLDKIKGELEAKIVNFEEKLVRASAENGALSMSLQERSNMLIKVSQEKAHAEAEIEHLKSNIESCEREINSLKYELHVVSKELEIRNEEKNMSIRSAEAANKQHAEGVKKIAKLEAECQRLRGLVRKKLPGPAALAQMKLEVEGLGHDYRESRIRKSPVKPAAPYLSPLTEFSLENVQKFQKENEFLSGRLLAMEEETKMLKEALAKRNSELQASRSMCAKTLSKLQSWETQHQQKGSPESITQMIHASNAPSLVSMSEDGNDDTGSCADSWSTAIVSGLSQFPKEKSTEKSIKSEATKKLELMDDFLEVEKLARLSNDTNLDEVSCKDVPSEENNDIKSNDLLLSELRSRILSIFEFTANDADVGKIIQDIKHIIETDKEATSSHYSNEYVQINSDLEAAISDIHDFVLLLGKEAISFHDISSDGSEMSKKIEEFSFTYDKLLCNNASLVQFVLGLSSVLTKASEFRFNVLGYKGTEAENNSPDCIDKIALPENKLAQDNASGNRYQNGSSLILNPCSDPEVPDDGNVVSTSKSLSDEYEELKQENRKLVTDLSQCAQNLQMTKSQLLETEQLLAEVKSELASAIKSNSLAETQLKCMAESYKSLEARAQELVTKLNRLQIETETLENKLQEEKKAHETVLAKSKVLEEQLQRIESSAADSRMKSTQIPCLMQEKDLATAAEKLAECQETIFLLEKQLNALHLENPKPESGSSKLVERVGSGSPLHFSNSLSSPDNESSLLARSPVRHHKARHRPTKSASSPAASSTPTPEKHARGFSRFFSSKGKPSR
ncbi:filament-like plant protein 4 isoform X1 [Arachis hypogaea]|uniref:filament-like plant protein 4 isoform X1 n=1 Tax=Arachis hypogaea TaxID=3818 RepID=UPI000DEC3D53|nr:filament-like plant protein 4 isoform X1 [Arachis hypogaea]XP_025612292.1 filament-like plant protein 4 isoform X1 [Arachis hypogaea]XP_025612293.1 filament-like plant protein 4 isoform X1 [Arachis hypogaea]XP_029144070.1 filament-like plant protein 4 isoform X1 [Arachis hypogaea]QHO29368.1 Filament-like plant protein [Arachis hypogaea]